MIQAGSGISNTGSGVRYATVQGGSVTTLEAIATKGGQILNARPFKGGWGIPLVDYTGGVGGLSANGRTLVLAQSGYDGVCTPTNCTPLRRAFSGNRGVTLLWSVTGMVCYQRKARVRGRVA